VDIPKEPKKEKLINIYDSVDNSIKKTEKVGQRKYKKEKVVVDLCAESKHKRRSKSCVVC
jgi:hypothetical protein